MPEVNVYLSLGLLLHNWHNGMDAVYGVGSNLVAGHDAPIEQVEEAIVLIENIHSKLDRMDFSDDALEIKDIRRRLKNYKMYLEFAPDEFEKGYFAAALWTSVDMYGDKEVPMHEIHGPYDIAISTLHYLRHKLKGFRETFAKELEETGASDSQNGHDLWLTRNGHGTGFWDRGYPNDVSKALSDGSKKLGPVGWYMAADGLIHES